MNDQKHIDWVDEAKHLFNIEKPEHFTNYEHCEECEEHDQTLLNSSIETISLKELGNAGWDPLCFSSGEGIKYYMPALIRLCLESIDDDFYFDQLLFHLEYESKDNRIYKSCNNDQRRFILKFIEYMILNYLTQLEENFSDEDAMRAQELWSQDNQPSCDIEPPER